MIGMTTAHFDLHRDVARALDDRTQSRNAWLRVARVNGHATEDLLRDLATTAEHWVRGLDADDLLDREPFANEPRPSIDYDCDGLFVRLEAWSRGRDFRTPAYPLVANPYPAVAHFT